MKSTHHFFIPVLFGITMTAGAQMPGSGHLPISATGQVPVASGSQSTSATNAGMPNELAPVMVPARNSYALNEVRKAIILGAMRHNWRLENESDGTIRLILDGRRDRAELVLDVVYDMNSYQIKYVSSVGLGLANRPTAIGNPTSNTASRTFEQDPGERNPYTPPNAYTTWITNLKNSINRELITLKL